jgi:putative tricarboxylic transport membrane protein
MTQTNGVDVGPDGAVDEIDAPPQRAALAASPLAQTCLGLAAAAFGVVAFVECSGLKMFGDHGVPGPGFFPASLSVALILLGLLQAAVSVVRGLRRGRGPTGRMRSVGTGYLRAGAVWAGLMVSIPLMTLIGFVPATILLIAYLVFVVERTRGVKGILVAVAVPIAVSALFVFLLGVDLPTSTLFEGI